jgi:hypothetical protein
MLALAKRLPLASRPAALAEIRATFRRDASERDPERIATLLREATSRIS